MDKLIIDRKKWLRGTDNGRLRKPSTGKMCCLGFEMLRRGFSVKDINRQRMPTDVTRERVSGLIYQGVNTDTCGKLADVNDDPDLAPANRESRIKKLFKRIGVAVKFIN